MNDESSIRARASDLLGVDPYAEPPARRPTVHRALAGCEPGQVVPARDRKKHVAVVRLPDGRAFVVPDRCPHDGGLLSDGYVDGDRLVCARHNWEFDPCSGSCTTRPGIVISTRAVARTHK